MTKKKLGSMASSARKKVSLLEVKLEEVNAKSRPMPTSLDTDYKLETEWTYTIRTHDKDQLVLVGYFKAFFFPEAVFEIEATYSITYRCKEELSTEEIKDSIELLLSPIASNVSLLVGQITVQLSSSPLIIPLQVEIDKE